MQVYIPDSSYLLHIMLLGQSVYKHSIATCKKTNVVRAFTVTLASDKNRKKLLIRFHNALTRLPRNTLMFIRSYNKHLV